jgi:hypothetical protein
MAKLNSKKWKKKSSFYEEKSLVGLTLGYNEQAIIFGVRLCTKIINLTLKCVRFNRVSRHSFYLH